jgi:Tfp pilus assembly protein PilN
VKAVNLLPEKHRPRQPTGTGGKSSYVVLGVLGAVLVGVLVYVMTLNSINDSKSKIKEATVEAARLNEQANSLGPYGDFANIKAERVKSVMQLAQGRFDYERLVRELSHVLPPDVWLVAATASSDGSSTTSGASATTPGPSPAPAAGTTQASPTGPTLTLQGCARDQTQVAVTLVRLRELQGATDVSLDHSTRGQSAAGGSTAAAPASSSGSSTGDTDCGTTSGKPNYSFQMNVTFAPATPSQPTVAPNRLGGGA